MVRSRTRASVVGDVTAALFRKYHLLLLASGVPDRVLHLLRTLLLNCLKTPFRCQVCVKKNTQATGNLVFMEYPTINARSYF